MRYTTYFMIACLISQPILCDWRDLLPEMPDFGIQQFFQSLMQHRPVETVAVVGGAGVIFCGGTYLYRGYQEKMQTLKKWADLEKQKELVIAQEPAFFSNYRRMKNNCEGDDLKNLQDAFLARARYRSGNSTMTLQEAEEEYCYKENRRSLYSEAVYDPATTWDKEVAQEAQEKDIKSKRIDVFERRALDEEYRQEKINLLELYEAAHDYWRWIEEVNHKRAIRNWNTEKQEWEKSEKFVECQDKRGENKLNHSTEADERLKAVMQKLPQLAKNNITLDDITGYFDQSLEDRQNFFEKYSSREFKQAVQIDKELVAILFDKAYGHLTIDLYPKYLEAYETQRAGQIEISENTSEDRIAWAFAKMRRQQEQDAEHQGTNAVTEQRLKSFDRVSVLLEEKNITFNECRYRMRVLPNGAYE